MSRRKLRSFLFLLCLLPLVGAALAWCVSGLLTATIDLPMLALMSGAVVAFSNLRIYLPRTKVFLSVADVFIIFVLINFGGEQAILLTIVNEIYSGMCFVLLEKEAKARNAFANGGIAIVTIFVTAATVTYLLGFPLLELGTFRNGTLLMLVAALTLLPCLTNSLLASLFLAIETEKEFHQVFRAHFIDALLVYSCSALMAGLFVVALREANVFLFVAVAGVLSLLHIVFRRYSEEQRRSIVKSQEAERERADLAEKHLSELQGYVEKIEETARELRASREKFRWAAYHDALTGLPNRNLLLDEVKLELARAQFNERSRFAFFILDLKDFKVVNESLGRPIGDALIIAVGERLQTLVLPTTTVGRIGGDKFALLIPKAGKDDAIVAFAEKLLEQVADPIKIYDRQFFLRATLGISIGSGDGEEAEDILRDAELAMHRAKDRSREFVMFDQRMLAHAQSMLKLETDLRSAVDNDEFEIYYQPIVELESTHIHGFEALVRWNHPTLGRVSPDRFISIAEATGLIVPMTVQILEKACNQLVAWNGKPDRRTPLFASVNLSGTHFAHQGLVGHITGVLDRTGLDPRLLKVEITETVVMENAENAIAMLRQIKELGVQVSIDDFGTGYSSLSYLQRFPIDTLKIDRAFVRSMEDGRQNGEIVRAVLALADAMKLNVVAEGIESIHQLHQLLILSCRYGQGYLFSPPLEASEFESLLDDHSHWQNLASGTEFNIIRPRLEIVDAQVH
jgi:diguanylate cyclase (GGDEF)-like protein